MGVRARAILATAIVLGIVAWRSAAVVATDPATDAIARLKAGNAVFVANPEAALPIDTARRTSVVTSQSPYATILSCADSRVPPEVIFHTGLGDLFVVRAAGNVTDRAILASIEYGADHLHVPLVVVMGHESCGAVQAAVETPADKSQGPNLDYLLRVIRPSVAATASVPEATRLRAAILRNVEETVNEIANKSTLLKELWAKGAVSFVGAYYELSSGKVYFSEPANVPVGAAIR
jgi:carbonic anhydrase